MARILLVEDNPEIRDILTRLLQQARYEVIVATNGADAVQIAQQQRPVLILMDLVLPLLDGWSATRQLKSDPHTAHIPILAITARVLVDDEAQAFAAGCDGFIPKPFDADNVLSHVAMFAGGSYIGNSEEDESNSQ